jgi:hypothetical protein
MEGELDELASSTPGSLYHAWFHRLRLYSSSEAWAGLPWLTEAENDGSAERKC